MTEPTTPMSRIASGPESGELDLVDILLIFARHRLAFWAAVIVFTLFGVAAAFYLPTKYHFTSLVEIGAQVVGNKIEPIETPESVAAKLQKSYIPQAIDKYYKAHPGKKPLYKVSVDTPQKSALVELVSAGPKQQQSAYREIQKGAIDYLRVDHKRILSVIKQGLEVDLTAKQNALRQTVQKEEIARDQLKRLKKTQANDVQSLLAKGKVLQTRLAGNKKAMTVVQAQIKEYRQLIDQAQQNREKATNEATDPSKGMTVLLLDSQVQQARHALGELKTRLLVGLPNEKDDLQKQIEDNARAVQNLKETHQDDLDQLRQTIGDLTRQEADMKADLDAQKLNIQNLRQTHAVAVASQSIRPVGLSKLGIIFVGLVAGILFGLAMVFLAELRRAVYQRTSAAEI